MGNLDGYFVGRLDGPSVGKGLRHIPVTKHIPLEQSVFARHIVGKGVGKFEGEKVGKFKGARVGKFEG